MFIQFTRNISVQIGLNIFNIILILFLNYLERRFIQYKVKYTNSLTNSSNSKSLNKPKYCYCFITLYPDLKSKNLDILYYFDF